MRRAQLLGFLACFVLISSQSCAQNKKAMDEKAASIIGNLYKDVKYKDQAVNYHAEIQIGACAFEVYVNDMYVHKYAGDDGSGSVGLSAPINMNILKSGVQTWEVRVFPPEVNGKRQMVLPEGVKVELSVEALKFRTDGVDHTAEPIVLLQTPKMEKEGRSVYADAGKPFMIYKGTFNAQVPYEVKGWSESVDLSKEDADVLKKELVAEYEKYRGWLNKRDLDKIAKGLEKKDKDRAQVTFYDKELNEDHMETFFDRYGADRLRMLPLENYKMVFSGNGKMVTLERADHIYYPALVGESTQQEKGEDKIYTMTYYMNFHRPLPGGPLEVIR